MANSFAAKSVVITGASSGIGRALAVEFARSGAHLLLTARSAELLAGAAKEVEQAGGRAHVVVADLAQNAELPRIVNGAASAFGGIDLLVNNAGLGLTAFLEDVPRAELERLFAVNVFAPAELTRLALPHLKRSERGLVVNVGSVVGRRGLPTMGAYCMTKFALAAYSESLRAEVARHGIHVLEVEPGQTLTNFSARRQVIGAHPRKYRETFALSAETVARRIVRAAERRRDRIVLGLPGRLMIFGNALAPWLLNWLLARGIAHKYGRSGGGA